MVMRNYNKNSGSFTIEERMDFIRRCTADLPNVTVDSHLGLLADYAKQKGACAVVKGLRAISDYDEEFRQALTNQHLNPELETVFMITSADYMFLSSSVVKEVCILGGDIKKFVPPQICDDIEKRLKMTIVEKNGL